MSGQFPAGEERLLELLAAQAAGDLSPEEARELTELRAMFPQIADDELELAAAMVVLADLPSQLPPLPPALRQRIAADAARFLPQPANGSPKVAAEPSSAGRFSRRELLAWSTAAAATLVAGAIWWSNRFAARLASPERRRQELLAAGGDLVRVAWQPGKHPFANPVTGDVIYSVAKQQGFMHFHGLPPNDPRREQYQLWIIDPSRDDEPIDGGVFDASGATDIVVPIAAKLRVNEPLAFAITVEKPGGVVVSKQDRLPLLAPVTK